jgi:hypothetical protein
MLTQEEMRSEISCFFQSHPELVDVRFDFGEDVSTTAEKLSAVYRFIQNIKEGKFSLRTNL